jgi:hypothetical protein
MRKRVNGPTQARFNETTFPSLQRSQTAPMTGYSRNPTARTNLPPTEALHENLSPAFEPGRGREAFQVRLRFGYFVARDIARNSKKRGVS